MKYTMDERIYEIVKAQSDFALGMVCVSTCIFYGQTIIQGQKYKRCRHATYPATGYFRCKENHFETRPFHAKFEENR